VDPEEEASQPGEAGAVDTNFDYLAGNYQLEFAAK
jgi:hypothetical protein